MRDSGAITVWSEKEQARDVEERLKRERSVFATGAPTLNSVLWKNFVTEIPTCALVHNLRY